MVQFLTGPWWDLLKLMHYEIVYCSARKLPSSTIPYGHFVIHHYFMIFHYRPQIYTIHLATVAQKSVSRFMLFHVFASV
jgi:hypothetical protein